MSLLRRTRTEMTGAWRSLRYDLGRAPARPPGDGPDVTSTGMGTWGLPGLVDQADPAPDAPRPRRAVAMTAFGTLTVIGGAAAYLAVVNGLGTLMAQSPVAADTFPLRPSATTAARMGAPATTGRVVKTARPVRPRPAVSPTAVRVTPPPAAALGAKVPAEPPRATTEPVRTVGPKRTVKPTTTDCRCRPPVPTPTAPPSLTPSSLTPSFSGSASVDPWVSESADPTESPSPSRSWDGRRHWRNH